MKQVIYCQTTIKRELTSVFLAPYTIALLVGISSGSTLLTLKKIETNINDDYLTKNGEFICIN